MILYKLSSLYNDSNPNVYINISTHKSEGFNGKINVYPKLYVLSLQTILDYLISAYKTNINKLKIVVELESSESAS